LTGPPQPNRKAEVMTTATFMRMIHEAQPPPDDPRDSSSGWWVNAALFRVNPPIEYTTYEVFRKGRLMTDRGRRAWREDMIRSRRLREGKMHEQNYRYRYVRRTTAFVISSAADLATMMDRSNKLMVKLAKERIEMWEKMPVEEGQSPEMLKDAERIKREQIAHEQETIRLFSPESRMGRFGFDVETYLFPSDKFCSWKNGGELEGSQRGTLDLRKPLEDIGYVVIGLPELPARPYEMTVPTTHEFMMDYLMREEKPRPDVPVEPEKIVEFPTGKEEADVTKKTETGATNSE
jgi:hypothetical protein